MADNGQNQMISMAGTLAIVVLALAAAFGLYKLGSTYMQKQTNIMVDTMAEAEESMFTSYENQTIKGSLVLNLVSQWKNQPVFIEVVNKGGQATAFNYTSADRSSPIDPATQSKDYLDATKAAFINPNGNFFVSITRDANSGMICGVKFTQDGVAGNP